MVKEVAVRLEGGIEQSHCMTGQNLKLAKLTCIKEERDILKKDTAYFTRDAK